MDYFQVSVKTRAKILKVYEKNDDTMAENVRIVREWMENQHHLPEVASDKKIENFILINKCSIERAKAKLDMYYTIRSLIPELFHNVNPNLEHMRKCLDVVYVVPLPQLTPDLSRITVFKLKNVDPDLFSARFFFASLFNLAEIRLNEDCILWDTSIFDFEGSTFDHIKQMTPSLIMKTAAVAEKVYSNRLKAIHFINCHQLVDGLITMVKAVLKPKLAQRIHIHKGKDALKEHFPNEILPRDYGGEEKSLEELNDIIKLKYEEYRERFDQLDRMAVDESLRPEKLKDDEVLGFHGSFKSLTVD